MEGHRRVTFSWNAYYLYLEFFHRCWRRQTKIERVMLINHSNVLHMPGCCVLCAAQA
jgi:hypothetical protein